MYHHVTFAQKKNSDLEVDSSDAENDEADYTKCVHEGSDKVTDV